MDAFYKQAFPSGIFISVDRHLLYSHARVLVYILYMYTQDHQRGCKLIYIYICSVAKSDFKIFLMVTLENSRITEEIQISLKRSTAA